MTDDQHDPVELDDAEVGVIGLAIENGGASVVTCRECGDLVGVDEQGLECGHGREHAPILDDERFDGVFDERSGVIGRLRALVATVIE